MQAKPAHNAGMKKEASRRREGTPQQNRAPLKPQALRGAQYPVRDVPAHVDAALRRRAREHGKSLSSLLREALARQAGIDLAREPLHHDLEHLAGRWLDDPEFDAAIVAQDRISSVMDERHEAAATDRRKPAAGETPPR